MTWESRWREMILAGGTVAVVACSTSSKSVAGPNFCCNANGDPCCEYKYCGGPLTSECTAEMACEAEGGTYGYYNNSAGEVCSFPSEAGVSDAPPQDATTDSASGDSPTDAPSYLDECCNATMDPCCLYWCLGGSTAPSAECSRELACTADGGTWQFLEGTCSLRSEAGPDATPDSEPPDAGVD